MSAPHSCFCQCPDCERGRERRDSCTSELAGPTGSAPAWSDTRPILDGYYWIKQNEWECVCYVEIWSNKIYRTGYRTEALSDQFKYPTLWFGPLQSPSASNDKAGRRVRPATGSDL